MFFGKEMHALATWATREDACKAAYWFTAHDEVGSVGYIPTCIGNTWYVVRIDSAPLDYPRVPYASCVTKGLLFAMMQLHAYDTSKHDALACIPYYREMPKERPHAQG